MIQSVKTYWDSFWTLTFDLPAFVLGYSKSVLVRHVPHIYLQGATVALLPLLPEAISTDGRGLDAEVVWFIQQAGGAAVQQVFLIVVVAAAAEGARDIPAEGAGLEDQDLDLSRSGSSD